MTDASTPLDELLASAQAEGRASAERAVANGWPPGGGPFYVREAGMDPIRSGRAYHEAWMAAYRERRAELLSAPAQTP